MNNKKLTLKEMAGHLRRCEKTFSKYVRLYKIPHLKLGRDMLFDADEVENFLRQITVAEQVQQPEKAQSLKSTKRVSFKDSDRYAKLLGLT